MLNMREQHHADFAPGRAEHYTGKTAVIKAWPGELLRWLVLFPPLRALTHLRIHGSEQLTGNGPYIFATNHSSHLDTPLLLAALPLRLRLRLRTAAAADYFFSTWWKGTLVKLLFNAFSFERRGLGGLHYAQRLLKEGYSVLLFPEGTRSKDGQLQPFKCGIGWLALTTQVCIVPVWIEGARAAMPKGTHLVHRHQVEIRFGAPLQFAQDLDQASVVATIEQQVRALAPLADNKGR
ncbi:MAG: 1-acyl-sn-glycerol-3-phosphate acyltransferase [Chloroflexota bacterium]|nr:1-acyl-sn-glycerol-3-phosphate acyltransferase [Chloroflexota bacterium]